MKTTKETRVVIKLGVQHISLVTKHGLTKLESDLKESPDIKDGFDHEANYNAAIDGMEALVLAHACAGVDVEHPKYVRGVEVAFQSICDNT